VGSRQLLKNKSTFFWWFLLSFGISVLLLALAVIAIYAERPPLIVTNGPVIVTNGPADRCLSQNDLSIAIRQLAAGSQSEAAESRQLLLQQAYKGFKCRKEMIGSLMAAMDKPNLDFRRDRSSYYLWHEGAQILGQVKAVEAIDLLLSHLDLNDGTFSSTMAQQPALKGIIGMGNPALPKLSRLLMNDKDSNRRHYAVYCISSIGGYRALKMLKAAAPFESDPCVKQFLGVSIQNLSNRRHTIADRVSWFSSFLCRQS
jgi:hypothetical protein